MHGEDLLGFMSCNITEWHAQFVAGFAGGSWFYLFFLFHFLPGANLHTVASNWGVLCVACVASVAWPLSMDS